MYSFSLLILFINFFFKSFQAAQKESTIKDLESQLKQVIENNAVQEQLLLHVVQQTTEHLSGFIELTTATNEEAGYYLYFLSYLLLLFIFKFTIKVIFFKLITFCNFFFHFLNRHVTYINYNLLL